GRRGGGGDGSLDGRQAGDREAAVRGRRGGQEEGGDGGTGDGVAIRILDQTDRRRQRVGNDLDDDVGRRADVAAEVDRAGASGEGGDSQGDHERRLVGRRRVAGHDLSADEEVDGADRHVVGGGDRDG